ncbi:type II secretion system F family protein [Dactylosporangium sp. NPDC051484]|uniref:type II secretion system F family protein n=1 Tax=Dactylosporangium sp. NPDC051484 TaxID=3154942 RepID=UPI00344BEC3C
MTGMVLLAGLGTGLGLWLIVVGWFPRPPRLDNALDAPHGLDRTTDVQPDTRSSGWTGRWGRPAVRSLRRAGLPLASTRRDLATVDKPVDVHLAEQATATVFGLLLPPVAASLLALGGAGAGAGLAMPAAASLLLGVAGFLAPELSVRSEAAKHRAAFRDALSSFLDLVVISLASGSGVDQALDDAAKVGSGPAYMELRYALTEARLARVPPWDILAALGRRVAVAELQQLAATVGLAGTEGAKVRASLRSRAVALRGRQLTDAEGEANAATERMALPIVALFAGFLIFLGYPAVAAVLGGL